jgi:hypothetical protein
MEVNEVAEGYHPHQPTTGPADAGRYDERSVAVEILKPLAVRVSGVCQRCRQAGQKQLCVS